MESGDSCSIIRFPRLLFVSAVAPIIFKLISKSLHHREDLMDVRCSKGGGGGMRGRSREIDRRRKAGFSVCLQGLTSFA